MWYVDGSGLQLNVPKDIMENKRRGILRIIFGMYEQDDFRFQIYGRDVCRLAGLNIKKLIVNDL
jgi:hypothetical protein